jgi:hypothetical protein
MYRRTFLPLPLLLALCLVPGCSGDRTADQGSEDSAAVEVETVIVPPGAPFVVQLRTPELRTDANGAGDSFEATLIEPIVIDGETVVPTGTDITGTLTEVTSSDDENGAGMTLTLVRMTTPAGNSSELQTAPIILEPAGSTEKDLEKVAAGTVAGGIIGGVLGGSKGAAIGAGVGAGTGVIVAVATKEHEIEIVEGQKLQFALREPVELARPLSS